MAVANVIEITFLTTLSRQSMANVRIASRRPIMTLSVISGFGPRPFVRSERTRRVPVVAKDKDVKLSAEESRAAFEQAGTVAFIDADYAKHNKLHTEIDRHLADDITDDDWTELKRTAKFNFPDLLHAKYQDLSAKQKLFAIADCEGWTRTKFNELSGVSRSTLNVWSKRADILLFMSDYKQAQGAGDPHKEYSQQAHKALRFYNEILDWRPITVEEKNFKFKVASYVTDRAHGPIGKADFNAVDLKKLSEEVRKVDPGTPSDAALDELFQKDK